MNSIINRPKVARRALFSNIASVGGLFMLLASVVIPLFFEAYLAYANILMVIGLGVAMVGIYFANRWVKKPRPETRLDEALKSLSSAHRLYHYASLPADHLLLTPAGLVVLETVNLEGEFTYKGGRWHQKIGVGRALRYPVEEHLGNPIKSARAAALHIENRLRSLGDGGLNVPMKAVVVFTHPMAQIEIEDSPIPVCKLDKLRKHLQPQTPRLEQGVYERMAAYLDSLV